MAIIYNFPDELVSNEAKLSKEFAREYALAMWNEWDSTYHIRYNKLKKFRQYAEGKQSPDGCKSKIKGKLILDKHMYRDWETDRKSTRLNSSHSAKSRMPSSA